MTRFLRTSSALFAALGFFGAGALSATEFGATHIVFEKATKMKKVESSLLMSFLDQSAKADRLEASRRLRCAVTAATKGVPLAVKGKVLLRLEGVSGASTSWQGSSLSRALDDRGDVLFDSESILDLVDEAAADDATPAWFRIDFDGGKGKKVAQVTLDCIHELTGEEQ